MKGPRNVSRNPGTLAARIGGISVILLLLVLTLPSCGSSFEQSGRKLVVIGIDGCCPRLMRQYLASGKLPHFKKLIEEGTFRELGTSNPPQSPVAWSNFITGMDSGGHGIFDFIHRDPKQHGYPVKSFTPEDGDSHLARSFWEYFEDAGIRASVFHIPANYPPRSSGQITFPDMGTPDLQGGIDGTYFFYTDDVAFDTSAVKGGRAYRVSVDDGVVTAALYGPDRRGLFGSEDHGNKARVPFQCSLDAGTSDESGIERAFLEVDGGDRIILEKGRWSDWIHVEFELNTLTTVSGICHFLLQSLKPFRLYCSPINIDPSDPAQPISTGHQRRSKLPPFSTYDVTVIDMTKVIGPHYTQGLAEETKALQEKVIDDGEFLAQCDVVTQERMRMLDYALDRFDDGLLFFYFSAIDLRSHMMWRHIEPGHPARDEAAAQMYANAILDSYRRMDDALGHLREKIGDSTPLIVMSDHGFAPFTRKVNLNNWLLENGYLVATEKESGTSESSSTAGLSEEQKAELIDLGYADPGMVETDATREIDWKRTRAYAKGFNGIYINRVGREVDGCVSEAEADSILEEIRHKLVADLKDGDQTPVLRVDKSSEIYQGPYVKDGPDLVVGYRRCYGASDSSALGELAPGSNILEDNTSYWSGNHLMAPEEVPGILVTNLKLAIEDPNLCDLTVGVLEHFGLKKSAPMVGRSPFVVK